MPAKRDLVYWDSCIFIDYMNREPSRIDTLDAVLESARRKEILIVTSTTTITEVFFAASEREGSLDGEIVTKLDELWDDEDRIKLIEFHRVIAAETRMIARKAKHESRKMKAFDAIHLASAKNIGASRMHTYDPHLLNWDGVWFPVTEPFTPQQMLPHMPTVAG
jgi:predicted nucleic acid-binding protein